MKHILITISSLFAVFIMIALLAVKNEQPMSTPLEDEVVPVSQVYSDEEHKIVFRVLPQNARVTIKGILEDQVFLDGKGEVLVPSGKYKILVEADDHESQERTVKVVAADRRANFALTPLNKKIRFNFLEDNGYTILRNDITEYEIYINDKRYYLSKDYIEGLPLGLFHIKIKHPVHGVWSERVRITTENMSIRVVFSPLLSEVGQMVAN